MMPALIVLCAWMLFVLVYTGGALLGLVGLFTASWMYGAEGRVMLKGRAMA